MTLSEFKAWFEGFSENLDGNTPSKKQWARIQERVGQIDGTAVTKEIIHTWWPQYVPQYVPYSYPITTYRVSGIGGCNTASGQLSTSNNLNNQCNTYMQLASMGAAESASLNN